MTRDGGLSLDALANLAHELRTPIQVLLGSVDMLREESGGPAVGGHRDILERMDRNIHELAATVENVTEFAQQSIGADAAPEEEVDLAELFEELRPTLEAANRHKRVVLRIDLSQAPAVIRTRRRALHSIVANLAGNALKFTRRGWVSIVLGKMRVGGAEALKLTVADSGPGIAPELLEQAFQPLVQLSASNARAHRGLGLGLAIVRRHLRMLRGSIRIDSAPGRGSLVTVVIPCVIPDGI